MIVEGKTVADSLFNLIDQEENILSEINTQLAQIDIHTDLDKIENISAEINGNYQKPLHQNLLNQSELIKKYDELSTEEKVKFIDTLQNLYSSKFAGIRKFDHTEPFVKYTLLDKYFSLLKDFDKSTAPNSVDLVKLSAIKRIIYPAGKDLIEKAVIRLEKRELKIDDTKSNEPFATSPHIPHNSDEYPHEGIKEPIYKDAVGPYRGIYPYPKKEQAIDEKHVNEIYLKDPNDFVKTVMNKETPGIYKPGIKNNKEASDIKEILVIVDPSKIQVQIGENKDGKLVFYASHVHLAIHHEELHMIRGLRGAGRGENGLPKQLKRAYHNLEEFLTIIGAKSNERLLNEQMGLPLRVGHSGATIGDSPGSEWMTNFVATQMIHDPKDLSNIDFTFYKWDLSDEYYKNANFSSSNLANIKLQNSILQNACFDNAYLEETVLTNADMANASMVGADLKRADLIQTNLVDAKLDTAALNFTYFAGANLSNAQLKNIDGINTNFQNANLTNTNFTNANLNTPDFTGANLTLANFEGATLRNGIFDEADLSGVNFKDATLDDADLSKAKNLDLADFTNVDLSKVKLPKDFDPSKKSNINIENKKEQIPQNNVSHWQGHTVSPKFSQLHTEREIKENPLQVLIDNDFLEASQKFSDREVEILSNPIIQEAIKFRDITVEHALQLTDNHLERINMTQNVGERYHAFHKIVDEMNLKYLNEKVGKPKFQQDIHYDFNILLPLISEGYLSYQEHLTEQEVKNLCNKQINDAIMCGELEAYEARQLSDEQVKRILSAGWNYDKVISKIKTELAQQLNTISLTTNLSIQEQLHNDIQGKLNNNDYWGCAALMRNNFENGLLKNLPMNECLSILKTLATTITSNLTNKFSIERTMNYLIAGQHQKEQGIQREDFEKIKTIIDPTSYRPQIIKDIQAKFDNPLDNTAYKHK